VFINFSGTPQYRTKWKSEVILSVWQQRQIFNVKYFRDVLRQSDMTVLNVLTVESSKSTLIKIHLDQLYKNPLCQIAQATKFLSCFSVLLVFLVWNLRDELRVWDDFYFPVNTRNSDLHILKFYMQTERDTSQLTGALMQICCENN
jgi:hypothetical protein